MLNMFQALTLPNGTRPVLAQSHSSKYWLLPQLFSANLSTKSMVRSSTSREIWMKFLPVSVCAWYVLLWGLRHTEVMTGVHAFTASALQMVAQCHVCCAICINIMCRQGGAQWSWQWPGSGILEIIDHSLCCCSWSTVGILSYRLYTCHKQTHDIFIWIIYMRKGQML